MNNNWKKYKFAELYDVASGLSKSRDQFGFGSPFVTFKNVFYNYFLPNELGDLANTTEKEQERGSVRKGDIFLTRTSETLHELGMSSVALKDYPNATFNGFCKRLRLKPIVKDLVDPIFIGYYLRSHFFRNEVSKHATMTTRASLNNTSINSLVVNLPSIDEQVEIGKILKALHDKIELNLQMNKTLEEMAMALYKHWFVDFGPFQDGEFVDSELGKIPKGWEVKSVKEFGNTVTGKTPAKKFPEHFGDEMAFVTPTEFKNYGRHITFSSRMISEYGIKKHINSIVPENSVIVTCIGSDMGKVAINKVPCLTNQQINSLKTENFIFMYHFFKSKYKMLKMLAGDGTTMPIINKSTFENIKIITPTNTLLVDFASKMKNIDDQIHLNTNENQALSKTRDTLLPKLISGELRVKEAEEMVKETKK